MILKVLANQKLDFSQKIHHNIALIFDLLTYIPQETLS
jgi:hypothetical protein